MWADLLADDDINLFQNDSYDLLKFGRLLAFDIDAGLNDQSWLPLDSAEAPEDSVAISDLFDED